MIRRKNMRKQTVTDSRSQPLKRDVDTELGHGGCADCILGFGDPGGSSIGEVPGTRPNPVVQVQYSVRDYGRTSLLSG
jgi:hypothetical protein